MRNDHAPTAFWWKGDPHDLPQDTEAWWPISDDGFVEPSKKLGDDSPRLYTAPPLWSNDLLRVSRAVSLADKLVERHTVSPLDHWTRHLRLSVPVSDPDAWRGKATDLLQRILQTLTGDIWDMDFHLMPRRWKSPPIKDDRCRAGEVTLFSGGLDSLSWAAQLAQVSTKEPLRLVMFIEKNFKQRQLQLLNAIRECAGPNGRLVWLFPDSQTPNGRCGRSVERSSRPRGLLYMATAIRAAAADRVDLVHVPENGQLALNPPLSPSRSAALSTRSVHPWTLHLLNELIRTVGGKVIVCNPLHAFTKGEVCKQALEAGLKATHLGATMSCGAPPRRHSGRKFDNCGTCFPCLIRRSGILRTGHLDYTDYEASPWNLSQQHKRSSHWRALLRWLADGHQYSALDLIADQPLPPGIRPAEWIDTIERGRKELRNLVRSAEPRAHGA